MNNFGIDCGLFINTVCTARAGGGVVNSELKSTWKEAIVAYY
jgi:hypothetical protein